MIHIKHETHAPLIGLDHFRNNAGNLYVAPFPDFPEIVREAPGSAGRRPKKPRCHECDNGNRIGKRPDGESGTPPKKNPQHRQRNQHRGAGQIRQDSLMLQ